MDLIIEYILSSTRTR